MGAAVAVRVSNFRGQNDRINVRRSAYAGFHIMLFIALIGALPIFLLRNELGGWFSDSPAVSVMVAQLIIPFIIYQFGDGLQINFVQCPSWNRRCETHDVYRIHRLFPYLPAGRLFLRFHHGLGNYRNMDGISFRTDYSRNTLLPTL